MTGCTTQNQSQKHSLCSYFQIQKRVFKPLVTPDFGDNLFSVYRFQKLRYDVISRLSSEISLRCFFECYGYGIVSRACYRTRPRLNTKCVMLHQNHSKQKAKKCLISLLLPRLLAGYVYRNHGQICFRKQSTDCIYRMDH